MSIAITNRYVENKKITLSPTRPDKSILNSAGILYMQRSSIPIDISVCEYSTLLPKTKEDSLSIYIVDCCQRNIEDCVREFKKSFSNLKFFDEPSVTALLKKTKKVLCFSKSKTTSAGNCFYYFVEDLDLKIFHKIQATQTIWMPEAFKDNPLTEREKLLIKSLFDDDMREFERIVKLIVDTDFREQNIRKYLAGICLDNHIVRLNEVSKSILDVEQKIDDVNRKLSELLASLDVLEVERRGLMTYDDCDAQEKKEEFIQYLISQKNISILQNQTPLSIGFEVRDFLEYVDQDLLEKMIKQKRMGIEGKIKKLFEQAFITQEIKLVTGGMFVLNFDRIEIYAAKLPKPKEMVYSNPHLGHYGCIGTYKQNILEALRSGDYIEAVELCVSSAKTLNFADGVVLQAYINDINRSGNAKIISKGGNLMSIKEWEECQ